MKNDITFSARFNCPELYLMAGDTVAHELGGTGAIKNFRATMEEFRKLVELAHPTQDVFELHSFDNSGAYREIKLLEHDESVKKIRASVNFDSISDDSYEQITTNILINKNRILQIPDKLLVAKMDFNEMVRAGTAQLKRLGQDTTDFILYLNVMTDPQKSAEQLMAHFKIRCSSIKNWYDSILQASAKSDNGRFLSG